jgi:branched-chain amino acid transport system ATP-binding protein
VNQLLRIDGLNAGYGRLAVVRDLSLSVEEGRVTALFGANGAGKTTTVLTIACLLPPLEGRVEILGRPLTSLGRAHEVARSGLGLVPDDRGIFPMLTVRQHLRLAAGRGGDSTWVLDSLPELGLHLNQKAGSLSGGEQQMLGIARALTPRPRLLVIDELSLGLAPIVARRLGELVRDMATEHGMGVLLVEQHAQLAMSLADDALVLDHGTTTFRGSAQDLANKPELLESSYLA